LSGFLFMGFYLIFFIWKSIEISLTASSVSYLCSGHVFTHYKILLLVKLKKVSYLVALKFELTEIKIFT